MDIFINTLMITLAVVLFLASYKALKLKILVFLKKDEEIENLEQVCMMFGKLYFCEGIVASICALLLVFFQEEQSTIMWLFYTCFIIGYLIKELFKERYIIKK
ncbi:hypothetical protein [Tepidibacter hydrothermalis]|uniref:DUF3784 domain-containing protein n=1 Tax=Tepidibacter hydrothermalis TaxID=3036126 RepID=A0ABY8E9N5_9FIRM|nr:hypothetical protein [Tepidibacter hydrothermalis]WFD09620.1 hypothetical protein P4S50_14680 [Tepidibacter hydrothermalis]